MTSLIARFDALRAVPDNWDGYGAAAPKPEVINLAQGIVTLIDVGLRKGAEPLPVLQISPTRVGGVLIEWESRAIEHEIEINPDSSISFLHRNISTGSIDTRKISPLPLHVDFLQELQQLLAA